MGASIQRRWCFIFLLIELSVITLVFVLPQVDLLDTAFQNDSEPLTIHALAVASPLVLIAALLAGWMPVLEFHKHRYDSLEILLSSAARSVLLASTLRC